MKGFRFSLFSIILSLLLFGLPTFANALPFSDSSQITPSYEWSLEWMYDNGLIHGDDAGTLRPKDCVNRAEYSKLLVNILGLEFDPGGELFKDTLSEVWYTPYVRTLRQRGTVEGYGDNSFGPANCVLKSEAIKMAVLEFNEGQVPDFRLDYGSVKGMTQQDWYHDYVDYALSANLLGLSYWAKNQWAYPFYPGVEADGKRTYTLAEPLGEIDYQPNTPMTREEVVEMLVRMKVVKDNDLTLFNGDYRRDMAGVPLTSREAWKLEQMRTEKQQSLSEITDLDRWDDPWETCENEGVGLRFDYPGAFYDCSEWGIPLNIEIDLGGPLYFFASEARDESYYDLDTMEKVRKKYAPHWEGYGAIEKEIQIDGRVAYMIAYPDNIYFEVYIPLSHKVIRIKSNVLDLAVGQKILNSLHILDPRKEFKGLSEVEPAMQSYQDQLVDYPYGELIKFYEQERLRMEADGLKGAQLVDEEKLPLYQEYLKMKASFVEKTDVFPEQVRGFFYYKEAPERLFAKVVNLPTHKTDGGGDFWDAYHNEGNMGPEITEKLTTGGLYRSDDGGETWERAWEGDRVVSAGVCLNDPKRMYVLNTESYGGGSGEAEVALYFTEDGGENWEQAEFTYNQEDVVEDSMFYMTWVGYRNILSIEESNCDHLLLGGGEEFGLSYDLDLNGKIVELVDNYK